jgi:hypothetical protein
MEHDDRQYGIVNASGGGAKADNNTVTVNIYIIGVDENHLKMIRALGDPWFSDVIRELLANKSMTIIIKSTP